MLCFIYSTPKLYNLYVNNGDTKRFNWSIAPFEYKEAGGRIQALPTVNLSRANLLK